jgi:hypothetical protein
MGRTFYAHQTVRIDGRKTTVSMHREILGLGPGQPEVDHRNGNGLDNRRGNLRLATVQQNRFNCTRLKRNGSSEYRGVSWNKDARKWMAFIQKDRRNKWLGSFLSEVDAALAYDEAAKALFSEFAALNFPFGVEHEEF